MKAALERRKTDQRINQIGALHALFAQKTSRSEYLRAVAELLKEVSGCENVGIRLLNRQGEIPYEASAGFDSAFLAEESKVVVRTQDCICARLFSEQPKPCDR